MSALVQHDLPRRVFDWDARLSEAVRLKMDKPFAWGENDCVICAADIVLAMTGIDYAEGIRGTYCDKSGSIRAFRERGLGDLEKTINYFFLRTPVDRVQRGDLVMVQGALGHSLSVCVGATVVSPGKHGLVHTHRSNWLKGWAV